MFMKRLSFVRARTGGMRHLRARTFELAARQKTEPMTTIFDTLANSSADYLPAIPQRRAGRDNPRGHPQAVEGARRAKAKHLAETTGIGMYTMVFSKPPLEKEEFCVGSRSSRTCPRKGHVPSGGRAYLLQV